MEEGWLVPVALILENREPCEYPKMPHAHVKQMGVEWEQWAC